MVVVLFELTQETRRSSVEAEYSCALNNLQAHPGQFLKPVKYSFKTYFPRKIYTKPKK